MCKHGLRHLTAHPVGSPSACLVGMSSACSIVTFTIRPVGSAPRWHIYHIAVPHGHTTCPVGIFTTCPVGTSTTCPVGTSTTCPILTDTLCPMGTAALCLWAYPQKAPSVAPPWVSQSCPVAFFISMYTYITTTFPLLAILVTAT